jgi:hypothetical protein
VDSRPLFVLRNGIISSFPTLRVFWGMTGFTMWRADRISPTASQLVKNNFIAAEYGPFARVRCVNLSAPPVSHPREKKGTGARCLDPLNAAHSVGLVFGDCANQFIHAASLVSAGFTLAGLRRRRRTGAALMPVMLVL